MAGGNAVQGPEIKWVQHRGHPCGDPGEVGETDAAGHDGICLVLQDRGFHRLPDQGNQDKKAWEKGGERVPIWTGLPLQGIVDRRQ